MTDFSLVLYWAFIAELKNGKMNAIDLRWCRSFTALPLIVSAVARFYSQYTNINVHDLSMVRERTYLIWLARRSFLSRDYTWDVIGLCFSQRWHSFPLLWVYDASYASAPRHILCSLQCRHSQLVNLATATCQIVENSDITKLAVLFIYKELMASERLDVYLSMGIKSSSSDIYVALRKSIAEIIKSCAASLNMTENSRIPSRIKILQRVAVQYLYVTACICFHHSSLASCGLAS